MPSSNSAATQAWAFFPPGAGEPPDLAQARRSSLLAIEPTDTRPTVLLPRGDGRRAAAEALVRTIYATRYGAAPRNFPDLMAARWDVSGRVTATCGLRFGSDGFFSTCYLDLPVHEAVSRAVGRTVGAEEILEVNTLASASRLHGTAIVADVILAAVRTGVVFGCFTAVARLAAMLAHQGLPLRRVADARVERVTEPERWGRYYEHDPGVYVVDARPALDRVALLNTATGAP